MTTAAEIRDALEGFLDAEIVCEAINGGGNRIECLTPLDYPSGDGVGVWVESYTSHFVVTDYGESLTDLLIHPPQDHKALNDQIGVVCAPLGVTFADGRLQADAASLDALGDAIWRVATAASRVALASTAFHPRRRQAQAESPFVAEVEHVLHDRSVTVEREHKIVGASGHRHTATIYLPRREAILEPIQGHWNQVSSVYAKFGDLSRANGYKLVSLLDDRSGALDDELARLLVQVSAVVQWTRRDEWLGNIS